MKYMKRQQANFKNSAQGIEKLKAQYTNTTHPLECINAKTKETRDEKIYSGLYHSG